MDSCRQESFVDSGVLSVLSTSLNREMKCDILYSLLASRLKASSTFPDAGEFAQWHNTFAQALERSAWKLRREQVLRSTIEGQASVTLNDLIVRAMAGGVFQAQRELAFEAFDCLARLPTDSPIAALLRERHVSQHWVKAPGGEEERRFTVRLLFAVSAQNACIDLFSLEFETRQMVEEHYLKQAFSTRDLTSPVSLKHHSFEMAARAFARSRAQIVAFVQGHKLVPVGSGPVPSKEHLCGAVRAPDSPSPR